MSRSFLEVGPPSGFRVVDFEPAEAITCKQLRRPVLWCGVRASAQPVAADAPLGWIKATALRPFLLRNATMCGFQKIGDCRWLVPYAGADLEPGGWQLQQSATPERRDRDIEELCYLAFIQKRFGY